jgi:hypothetical protein
MIKTLTKEIINGSLRAVENVIYANGKHVKRILNTKTGMPEAIITVNNGKGCTQSYIALSLARLGL